MFAASCSEDVHTLALLVDEVNPVFRIFLLLAFVHNSFGACLCISVILRRRAAALTLLGRCAILNNSIFEYICFRRRRAMKTPQQLLQQPGLFRQIYDMQMSIGEEEPA